MVGCAHSSRRARRPWLAVLTLRRGGCCRSCRLRADRAEALSRDGAAARLAGLAVRPDLHRASTSCATRAASGRRPRAPRRSSARRRSRTRCAHSSASALARLASATRSTRTSSTRATSSPSPSRTPRANGAAQLANAFADALVNQRTASFQSQLAGAVRRDNAQLAGMTKAARQGLPVPSSLAGSPFRPSRASRIRAGAVRPGDRVVRAGRTCRVTGLGAAIGACWRARAPFLVSASRGGAGAGTIAACPTTRTRAGCRRTRSLGSPHGSPRLSTGTRPPGGARRAEGGAGRRSRAAQPRGARAARRLRPRAPRAAARAARSPP